MNPLRKNLIDSLDMISSLDRQKDYHEKVPIADVPSELISSWFDDCFYVNESEFLQLFSTEEWDALCHFNEFYESRLSLLPDNFDKLLNSSVWLEVVAEAKKTMKIISSNSDKTKPT